MQFWRFSRAMHVLLYHRWVNIVLAFGIHRMYFEYIFNEEYSYLLSPSTARR